MKKLQAYFKRQSIKRKWTITSALTIIFSYALISLFLYIAVHNWLYHEEKSTAERTAYDVQSFFTNEGDRLTIQQIQNNTTLVNAIVDQDQTVRLYNNDGIEIIRINNVQDAPASQPSLQQIQSVISKKEAISGVKTYIVYVPVQIGQFSGYMELIHPLTTFYSMMHYLITMLVLLGLGALLIAAVVGRYLATYLLKPIAILTQSMKTVREEGIHAQVQLKATTEDEVGELLRIYKSMLGELKQSFEQQQQFVQDASHELRTPIQAIEGHLSLINRWGKNDPQVLEESLQTSIEEVKKMKKLMEELLLLAKNDQASLNDEANILAICEDVRKEITFIHPEAKISLQFREKNYNVAISQQALKQIIRNIVENAVYYSDEEPVITITVKNNFPFYTLFIEDRGIGIEEQHLPYIFNRFYRADDARTASNGRTGLGLSITKMLADKYGVLVNVESKVGSGTIFTLQIPVAHSIN